MHVQTLLNKTRIGYNGNCTGPSGSLLVISCFLLVAKLKPLNPGEISDTTGQGCQVCGTKPAQRPIKKGPKQAQIPYLHITVKPSTCHSHNPKKLIVLQFYHWWNIKYYYSCKRSNL